RPHREHVADRPAARLGLAPADAGRALVVAGVRAPPALAPRIAVGREGDHARAAAAEVHGAVDVAAQVAAAAIHAHARVHREAVAAPRHAVHLLDARARAAEAARQLARADRDRLVARAALGAG